MTKYFFSAVLLLFLPLIVAAESLYDNDLLDVLVAKNILTKEEAAEIKKESAETPVCSPKTAKRFRTLMILQTRYTYVDHDYSGAGFSLADESRFNIRRFIPVFIADTSENSRFMLTLYMPSSSVLNTVDYQIDVKGEILAGKLKFGHWSVNFVTEECDSCSVLKTPDRSILCLYFGGGDSGYDRYRKTSYGTALGFSGYHTGVYWDGYIPGNKEFVYSLTVTNSKPNDICFRYDNGISTWLTLGYDASFEDYSIITGVTLGYSDKTVSAIDTNVLPSNISDFGDAYGFNPYFRSTWGDLSFDAELMFVSVEYGKTRSNDIPMYTTRSATANPWGFYVLAAYKIFKSERFGEIEPAFRYSYIDTDGRGIRGCDVIYKMNCGNGLYNKVHSYYAGINWYLNGRYLKCAFGVEHLDFSGTPAGGAKGAASSNVAIAQLQILF